MVFCDYALPVMDEPVPIENLEVVRLASKLSDEIYLVTAGWDSYARHVVGRQLATAVDSLGANMVEGGHRQSPAETLHFFHIARASGEEARWWLERVSKRRIMSEEVVNRWTVELTQCLRMLQSLINYRKRTRK
jgi:four helix bundle protein